MVNSPVWVYRPHLTPDSLSKPVDTSTPMHYPYLGKCWCLPLGQSARELATLLTHFCSLVCIDSNTNQGIGIPGREDTTEHPWHSVTQDTSLAPRPCVAWERGYLALFSP